MKDDEAAPSQTAGFFPNLPLPATALPDYPVNAEGKAWAALNRLDGMRRGPPILR